MASGLGTVSDFSVADGFGKASAELNFIEGLLKRNCLSPSMTQIIPLHIKLQETVPAGSINIFITQPHNFPPGRRLGKQAPILAATFYDENREIIMMIFISSFVFKF